MSSFLNIFRSIGLFLFIYYFKGVHAQNEPEMYSSVECARECQEDEPPKICHYEFILEQYSVLGTACVLCKSTAENQFLNNCECITADGIERMVLTANRMLPGPTIQVCHKDKVVVDVTNKIPGQEVTLHWHGIIQNGSQYYDGVPMVTQCAIPESTSFRYQWIAEEPGTYFWHSHSGLQRMEGLYGSIIIRQPKSKTIQNYLYDFDLTSHVIIISDWYRHLASDVFPGRRLFNPGQTARNLLINGKGIYIDITNKNETNTPMEVFQVTPGKRYRFRIVNAMSSVCTSIITVEKHRLQVIATDGHSVDPVIVDAIISLAGERYDFVLEADQDPKSYWIHVRGLEECEETKVQNFAVLQYGNIAASSLSERPTYDNHYPDKLVANSYQGLCDGSKPMDICVTNLKSAEKVDYLQQKPDMQIYMPFSIVPFDNGTFSPDQPYEIFFTAPNKYPVGSMMSNNITYIAAPSPLISQLDDIGPEIICNSTNKPAQCQDSLCSCTYVINIPLNSVVEIVLIDIVFYVLSTGQDGPSLIHPFHLHGYSYSVVAMGNNQTLGIQDSLTYENVKQADRDGRIKRNLNSPPLKDTVIVPKNGYTILRFKADNPGPWFFHCHFEMHQVTGMALVFHVGEQSDLPPVPSGFPKCGDFQAPISNDVTVV